MAVHTHWMITECTPLQYRRDLKVYLQDRGVWDHVEDCCVKKPGLDSVQAELGGTVEYRLWSMSDAILKDPRRALLWTHGLKPRGLL